MIPPPEVTESDASLWPYALYSCHLQLKFNPANNAHFVSRSVHVLLTSEFMSIYTNLSTWCLVSYCETMMKAARNEFPVGFSADNGITASEKNSFGLEHFHYNVRRNKKDSDFCSTDQPTVSRPATPALRCFWKPGELLKGLSLLNSHIPTHSHSFISHNAVSNWLTPYKKSIYESNTSASQEIPAI